MKFKPSTWANIFGLVAVKKKKKGNVPKRPIWKLSPEASRLYGYKQFALIAYLEVIWPHSHIYSIKP